LEAISDSEKPAADERNGQFENGWNGATPYFLQLNIVGGGIAKAVVRIPK
jgi:hypothetical protein